MITASDPLLLPMANAMAAAYIDGAVPDWENDDRTCHVFFTSVQRIATFIFLGTTSPAEWLQDFNPLITMDDLAPAAGHVHQISLSNVRAMLPHIQQRLDELGWPPFYLCGHSKGAREAPLCHAALKSRGLTPTATYLFEPPRAAGPLLRDYLAADRIVATQTWNCHGADVVTLVPNDPMELVWCHVRRPLPLQVPDSFNIADKHRMVGVIAGINALPQAVVRMQAVGVALGKVSQAPAAPVTAILPPLPLAGLSHPSDP